MESIGYGLLLGADSLEGVFLEGLGCLKGLPHQLPSEDKELNNLNTTFLQNNIFHFLHLFDPKHVPK